MGSPERVPHEPEHQTGLRDGCLRRAAVQGFADAEFSLGLAYAEGRGVKKDAREAYGWMQRASRRGHAPAIAYVKEIQSYREKKRQARD
jgi:TPR repeat protein